MGAQFDAVVVGSGFGGSIAAARIARAGRSVLVLERGRRWAPNEFPRDVTDVARLLWNERRRPAWRGLYELRFFSALGVAGAAGVGGGSLVYANIHIRPDAELFEDPRWPAGYSRAGLDPYYDRVAGMLGIAPLPAEHRLPKRDRFREAAERLGRPVFDPDQAVAWREPGPGGGACRLCAECEFGCPHGAKNTLDFTYLRDAEAHGAEVRPHARALAVEPVAGGYRVRYRALETGTHESVTGTRVVLSAGTLGTNEILLRSRDEARTLPRLSPLLGHGFSGNGDFLGSIQNASQALEPWTGPDVTSVIRFSDEAPRFTMAAPTFNEPTMAVLASFGQPPHKWFDPMLRPLWPALERLIGWALRNGHLSAPLKLKAPNAGPPGRMTNLFAIGRDNANGRITLRRGRLDVSWDYARENAELVRRMTAAMEAVADAYGGTFAPVVTWKLFRRILTVHPLGGCNLSDSPERGVVSPEGEVHGYPGLFVADGSVVPTSIGFHPAMTISAVAERIADAVVAGLPAEAAAAAEAPRERGQEGGRG